MTESDIETEAEILELADIYSSSSWCPSTDGDASDTETNGSFNQYVRNTSKSKGSKKTRKIDVSNSAGTDVSVEDKIHECLNKLRKLKDSSDWVNDSITFLKSLRKKYATLTPEQHRKVKTLDIEMEDISEDDYKVFDVEGKTYNAVKATERKLKSFTKAELDMIEENWNCFCEDYGLDPKEDLDIFLDDSFISPHQGRMFKLYLSQHIPIHRPQIVYLKFLEMNAARSEEEFTSEEDELLLILRKLRKRSRRLNYFASTSSLSRMLQRPAEILNRRTVVLFPRSSRPSRKNIMPPRIPLCVEDIVDRKNDEYPDWTKNEEAWKEIAESSTFLYNVKELKKVYFRDLYPSARASQKVGSVPFKRCLIKQMKMLKDPTWDNVDWKELGKSCYNVGAVRVYSAIRTLTKKYVPKEKWNDLEAVLKTIEEKKFEPHQKKIKKSNSKLGIASDVKGIGAPSENYGGKNVAGDQQEPDSHRTVVKNFEAVESPKKRSGQGGRNKAKFGRERCNNVTENEESQVKESDTKDTNDDANAAVAKRNGRCQEERNNSVTPRRLRREDSEIEESHRKESTTDPESPVVTRRKTRTVFRKEKPKKIPQKTKEHSMHVVTPQPDGAEQ